MSIIVSTTSETEAMAAAYALDEGLAGNYHFRVYLNGHLRAEGGTRDRPAGPGRGAAEPDPDTRYITGSDGIAYGPFDR